MMPCRPWLPGVGLALLLAACTTADRPIGAVCQGLCPSTDGTGTSEDGPVTLMRTPAVETAPEPAAVSDAMASEELRDQLRALMQRKADDVPAGVPERALGELPDADDARVRLLSLSSGGPFGAFGAGFLNGWSEQTEGDLVRPERFDVVTGVSAGALLATHAFIGHAGDPVLARQFTTISTEDVFRERSLLGALFSNAFTDTAPLRRTLEGLVTPELLDQVADATEPDAGGLPNRFVLVLAVNLDSGLPRIFDLGEIARDRGAPDRIDRYIDALMASAAIPVAFPPVFVDGDMHVDGGARLALFFNRFMSDQMAAIEGREIPPPLLDVIVNAEVTVEPACTRNTVVGIGRRSIDVILNQLTLDSLYRTISEAERSGIDVRYVTAEGSACTPPEDATDPFESAFLQCLFAFGEELGSSEAPWKTGLDDFPNLAAGLGGSAASACPAG